MNSKPLIGITLDHEEKGGYSPYPWYALRENYIHSLIEFDVIPLPLYYDPSALERFLPMISGIIVTGGDFDIAPEKSGLPSNKKIKTKPSRTYFEENLILHSLKTHMPILGICGGEQLMNVVCGGTMIQHIPDHVDTSIDHEQKNPRHEPSHKITIKKDTQLFKFVNQDTMYVNSSHHQAVDKLGKNLLVSAVADDGIIEAIEHVSHPFFHGVQWHPEFLIDNGDRAIFNEFIKNVKSYDENRTSHC